MLSNNNDETIILTNDDVPYKFKDCQGDPGREWKPPELPVQTAQDLKVDTEKEK